jgi:chorismate mutase / prephenate dehydratase
MHDLTRLREQIDVIDNEIVALLVERGELALKVRQTKGDGPIYRPEREVQILQRLSGMATDAISASSIQTIFTEIIAACRNAQLKLKVAYLGPAGSYSYSAASKLIGSSSELVPCASISDALRTAEIGEAEVALLPIENSAEGLVVETHKLLLRTSLCIINEVKLDIRHCLLSKCEKLEDITTVYAHPQALGQCRNWLSAHMPKAERIAQASNSKAAELAADMPCAAAIASAEAAELYDLHVVERNINDDADNQTRFVLLGKHPDDVSGNDKTSLICVVDDKPGSLYAMLRIFADKGINLVRLVSHPIADNEYAFYIDLEGHQQNAGIAAALDATRSVTKQRIILGSYPKARN